MEGGPVCTEGRGQGSENTSLGGVPSLASAQHFGKGSSLGSSGAKPAGGAESVGCRGPDVAETPCSGTVRNDAVGLPWSGW